MSASLSDLLDRVCRVAISRANSGVLHGAEEPNRTPYYHSCFHVVNTGQATAVRFAFARFQRRDKAERDNIFANDSYSQWPNGGDDLIQLNVRRPNYQGEKEIVRTADKKGGDWEQWPPDLRIREFPKPERSIA